MSSCKWTTFQCHMIHNWCDSTVWEYTWKRWSIVGTLLPFCRNPFKVEGFHKWSPEMIQIPRQSRKTRCLDTARYTPRGRGSTEWSTVVHDPVSHNQRSGKLPYMKGNKYRRYNHFPRKFWLWKWVGRWWLTQIVSIFSSRSLGKMFQFDLRIFIRWVGSTTN